MIACEERGFDILGKEQRELRMELERWVAGRRSGSEFSHESGK